MPEHIYCRSRAEWGALVETLDAVSVVAEWTTGDGDGERHRAALLALVLLDYRAFVAATIR